MGARRELRYYPTETFMDGLLRRNDIGQNQASAIKDSCGSFITGGFYAEDGTEKCRRGRSSHKGDNLSVAKTMSGLNWSDGDDEVR